MSESGFGVTEHCKEDIKLGIYALEGIIAQHPDAGVLPAEHMFVPGLYFRRFEMEEGSVLTGKIHAQDDGLIIASGKVRFKTEHSDRTYEGPCMVTVKAGTKPVLRAYTHVVFFSAHLNPDDSRDPEEIEKRVVIYNELGCLPAGELS